MPTVRAALPNDIVKCGRVRAPESLGRLNLLLWYPAAWSVLSVDVNPSTSHVDAYKKNMFALLASPAYEDRKAEQEAKLTEKR